LAFGGADGKTLYVVGRCGAAGWGIGNGCIETIVVSHPGREWSIQKIGGAGPVPKPNWCGPSSAPSQTPAPTPSTDTACVSHNLLKCINSASSYWPKCDPSQTKTAVGPAGPEFGMYCTQAWTDALNEMLSDPSINKCSDSEAIRKVLAQVAYETGYFSTVYQPKTGGAGLIQMKPANWPRNSKDMDTLWPGNDYATKQSYFGKNFFQTPKYGWKSVGAWLKTTNDVIPNCGLDLFDQSFETQTRCILSSPQDRSESYKIVGECMASNPAPIIGNPTAPPRPLTDKPTPSPTTGGPAPLTEMPTPSPTTGGSTVTPGPGTCIDSPLENAWSSYTCAEITKIYGESFCAHPAIGNSCCICKKQSPSTRMADCTRMGFITSSSQKSSLLVIGCLLAGLLSTQL
jgi:hypothetical protein